MGIKITVGVLGLTLVAFACIMLICRKRNVKASQVNTVVQGIREKASDFDGLYESLYLASKNTNEFLTDAYREWCDRASQSLNTKFKDAFLSLFSKEDIEDEGSCRKLYGLLLNCIYAAGISRADENGKTYTADENMCKCYLNIDGKKPIEGNEYTVLKAAWIYENKVIEYGMVIPAQN